MLLSLLLTVLLCASCGPRQDAQQPARASTPTHPPANQNGIVSAAEPIAQEVGCDFSSYKPLVKSTSGGPAVSKPSPRYPSEAMEKKVGGQVRVKILISAESGKVEQACVVEGHELLTGAARAAALQARFSPYLGGDKYIRENYRYIESVITYDFVIQ